MQTFEEFFQELLIERQILFNQGKKYGQIVFMAGGAGSGKGFAQKNFMEISKFKVRDVDEWKRAFMEISRIQRDSTDWEGNVNKKYLDKKGRLLGDLDLKNPEHVFALHMAVKKLGVKNKSLTLLLKDLSARHLPNILFDVTLKDMDDIAEVLPDLHKTGYDARNVHVVWVLTNYHVAVERNQSRTRVVPDDILLKTHEGAANTMYQLIRSKGVLGLDGGVHVILNNKENTIFYTDPEDEKGTRRGRRVDDSELDTGLGGVYLKRPAFPIIKDFTYITLKREGQPFYDQGEVNQQVLDWIKDNVPRTKETQHFWGGGDTNESVKKEVKPKKDKKEYWWLTDNVDKERKPVNPKTKYSIIKRKK